MIELGSKVRDVVTGYTGIVTARTTYLSGNVKCLVEQPFKDDKFNEAFIDEIRLVDLGMDQECLVCRDLASTLKTIDSE